MQARRRRPFATCTSPQTLATLADGPHTFTVRATDAAGLTDPTPATRSFTVDTAAPNTAIDEGPNGTTPQTTPQFTFFSNEPGSTFECRVDAGAFETCTTPRMLAALADGEHTFSVRAIDAAGNTDQTPATRTFTVDATPPETTISSTVSPFAFSSSELGSTFECRVDSDQFATCTSPRDVGTLADGEHTFYVRAIDAVGNVDPTPAARTFTVDTTAPETTINTGPSGTTGNASPAFTFSASEAGAAFECKLDGPGTTTGSFADCTSPRTFGPLADGGVHALGPRA